MIRHLTKKGVFFFFVIDAVLVLLAVSVLFFRHDSKLAVNGLRLTSPAFEDGGLIPIEFTCDGRDVHPPLAFSQVPSGTVSFALTVEDPDAAFGTWTHWTLWNVPATATGVDQAAVPKGAVEGKTSAGSPGWHGPCPPFGTHRYVFRLQALDAPLSIGADADPAALANAVQGHVLQTAELQARYEKKK